MLSAITAVCCWSVGCNTGGKAWSITIGVAAERLKYMCKDLHGKKLTVSVI